MPVPISDVEDLDFLLSRTSLQQALSIWAGDSIIGGSSDISDYDQQVHGQSYATLACALSQGKLLMYRNAGVGGNTSDQLRDRFQSQVLDYRPGTVVIGIGTNDVEGPVPLERTIRNVATMALDSRKIGARVLVVTIPPKTPANTLGKKNIIAFNARLPYLAEQCGFIPVDTYTALADSSGNYAAGMDSGDGVHLSRAGVVAAANRVVAATAHFPIPLLPLCNVTTDSGRTTPHDWMNMVRNGCFVTGSTTPTFWTTSADANNVYALVDDANIVGKWAQITKALTGLKTAFSQTNTPSRLTDIFIDTVNTKVGSLLIPFISTDTGKLLVIDRGNGFTPDQYMAMTFASNLLTLDRSPGVAGSQLGEGILGVGGGFREGDRVCHITKVQTEDFVSGGMTFQSRIEFDNATQGVTLLSHGNSLNYDMNPVGGAVLYAEGTVPPGTTSITDESFTNSGTGILRFANRTLRNLTLLEAYDPSILEDSGRSPILSRAQAAAIINAGGAVLWNGRMYSDIGDLPSSFD